MAQFSQVCQLQENLSPNPNALTSIAWPDDEPEASISFCGEALALNGFQAAFEPAWSGRAVPALIRYWHCANNLDKPSESSELGTFERSGIPKFSV